jgi:hypothetical protein
MLPLLGTRRIDTITPGDVADLVAALAAKGRKRETIRKTLLALGMVLDHAGVTPNPARDKMHVKLPRGERVEIQPPTAEQVLAVHSLLPTRYRLPWSCSRRPGCGSASSRGSAGATWTSHAAAGASPAPSARRRRPGG